MTRLFAWLVDRWRSRSEIRVGNLWIRRPGRDARAMMRFVYLYAWVLIAAFAAFCAFGSALFMVSARWGVALFWGALAMINAYNARANRILGRNIVKLNAETEAMRRPR